MSYNALGLPKVKWFDSNGDPASGWLVYTYESGTTTPKTTYQGSDGAAAANLNPVELDSDGEADIYLDGLTKIVMKNAAGVTQWTLETKGAAVETVSFAVVAAAANLGTGTADGELKLTADNGNLYSWDDGNSKWRVRSGNMYATASLPGAATYTIETDTVVIDTTLNILKRWNGTAWGPELDQEFKTRFLL